MADVTLRPEWVVTLSGNEFTLVLKALGGRLGTPELVEQARELGDRLTSIRANSTKQLLQVADGALDKLKK
jgi:hypothetical protein